MIKYYMKKIIFAQTKTKSDNSQYNNLDVSLGRIIASAERTKEFDEN